MQRKTIELGGQSFELTELPLKKNVQWRKLFESKLEPLIGMAINWQELELNNMDDVKNIVSVLREVVLKSPEVLGDLIIAYSPALQDQRAWLDENAYESELLAAITEVLQLAYPFGAIINLVKTMIGAAVKLGETTLMNSASQNGLPQEAG